MQVVPASELDAKAFNHRWQAADVLSVDEADWMKIVGPTALQEKLVRPWRKHVRAEQQRELSGARSSRTP